MKYIIVGMQLETGYLTNIIHTTVNITKYS